MGWLRPLAIRGLSAQHSRGSSIGLASPDPGSEPARIGPIIGVPVLSVAMLHGFLTKFVINSHLEDVPYSVAGGSRGWWWVETKSFLSLSCRSPCSEASEIAIDSVESIRCCDDNLNIACGDN